MTAVCTVCGELTHWAGLTDTNALCTGCAPNLAQSLDTRLRYDALQVPPELTREILSQCRTEQYRRWSHP